MNVVSLVILRVSAECEEVLEGVGVVALLDIAGAQVMVEGNIKRGMEKVKSQHLKESRK